MANDPLRVYCRNCGAPAAFDIMRQTYACASCGSLTGIAEAKRGLLFWQRLQKENRKADTAGQNAVSFLCPSCGAQVCIPGGEANASCDFCGTKLVRGELMSEEQLPDLIIPFAITREEARAALLKWGHEHEKSVEGRSVVSSMGQFRGYYLPYLLVRGPVRAEVSRENGTRTYHCAGHLERTVVNLSGQLDNMVLNEMEPFDFSSLVPFDFGYLAGMPAKFSDISAKDADWRVKRETAEDFRPEVERVLQTKGVDLDVETGELMTLRLLLPVYFIRSGKLTAVMNGQTGRIAVSKDRVKKHNPWMIEPALYTLIATLLLGGFLFRFEPGATLMAAIVFACIFFGLMSQGRNTLYETVTKKTAMSRAVREGKTLRIEETGEKKAPQTARPVFYEQDRDGKAVWVKIRFYTLRQMIRIILNTAVTVFLPAVIAAPVAGLLALTRHVPFAEHFHWGYGAAWYILGGFIAIIYYARNVRGDLYDHPYIFRIGPDGKKKLMGRMRDRRVSVLSTFGVGKYEDGKRVTFFALIRDMGRVGVFLILGLGVILLGSTLAILF